LAYRAITVYGASFQKLLLASPISNLMPEGGSSGRLVRDPDESESHTRLFAMSQPLVYIRLPTYLPYGLVGEIYLAVQITFLNCQAKVNKVWALPRSLATTNGIFV
jgi:hypothetical protein